MAANNDNFPLDDYPEDAQENGRDINNNLVGVYSPGSEQFPATPNDPDFAESPDQSANRRYLVPKRRLVVQKTFSRTEETTEEYRRSYFAPSPSPSLITATWNPPDQEFWRSQIRKYGGVKRDRREWEEEQWTESRGSFLGDGDRSLEEGEVTPRRPRVAPFRDPRDDSDAHWSPQREDPRRQERMARFKGELERVSISNPTGISDFSASPSSKVYVNFSREEETRRVYQSRSPTSVSSVSRRRISFSSPASSPPSERKRRPIVIDGSNVAFGRSNDQDRSKEFESEAIKVCVDYFLQRGFTEITVVVPEHRLSNRGCRNPEVLRKLKKNGLLITCWSKKLPNGRWVSSYDDRMIVEIAHKRGGVIISNDQFRDLLRERPEWTDTIARRVVGFRFMPGMLNEIMFPEDPLGRYGPSLEDLLRF